MKIKTLIGLSMLALTFAACDKVESDNYITAGSSSNNNTGGGHWSSGHQQRVLVEKYTGPHCLNCPNADRTLDTLHEQYGNRLVVISISDPSDKPYPGDLDLRTDAGNTWSDFFGVSALPTAYINRDRSKQYTGSMGNIGDAIGVLLNETPAVEVEAEVERSNECDLAIRVKVSLLRDVDGPVALTLVLVEDSLAYRQSSQGISGPIYDYMHNHMLRTVITPTWGEEIPMEGTAGSEMVGLFNHTVSDPTIVLEHCHIVAFVSRVSDRTVLNCLQIPVE